MSDPKSTSREDRAWLYATGAIVAALLLPAAAVGAALWWAGRKLHLGRIEGGILIAVGVVGFALDGADHLADYFGWWPGGIFDARPWFPPPVLPLILTGCIIAGAGLLVSGTFIASKVPNPFKRKSSPLDSPSILPTDADRAVAKIVAPPGGLTVEADQHSILTTQTDGRRFPIGVTVPGGQPVYLTETELGYHTVLFGSTGSGKSETLKTMTGAMGDLGWDIIVLDLKEDTKPGGLRDFCRDYAQYHALPYQEMRLSDTDPEYWFNPFRGMGADEARDTILTLAPADDYFWGALSSQMIGQGLALLFDAHLVAPSKFPAPSPFELGRLFSQGEKMPAYSKDMRAAVLTGRDDRTKDDYRAISSPTPDEAKNAPGLGAKLMTIYQSNAGRAVLRPGQRSDGSPKRELDVTAPGITYIGLDSLGKPELTRMISAATLQRMSVEAAQRTTGSASIKPRALIVDEANNVNRGILQNLLSRARSARLAMILATQGPLDWDVDQSGGKGQGVAGFNALAQNLNIAIIMRQGEPESATVCAEFIGKRSVYQTSSRIVGDELTDVSARQTLDYWVPPDELRSMRVGDAVLRVGVPDPRIEFVKIVQRDAKAVARR